MDFSTVIIDWYAANRRELPWRDITDPYRIWLSEIILQQTQVAQGYDYYLRFIRLFPTVDDLAAATEDVVLNAWQGLGYYSRARNLHAAAKHIVALGHFPSTYKGVRALKGVGDYTAAAICSFAYGMPCAVVDGNVYRVLSRHFGVSTPIDSTAGKREFATLARRLLDEKRPGLYNQAIMDFGAIQCTPRNPQCLCCPLTATCLALRDGRIGELPVKSKRTAVVTRYFVYVFPTDGKQTLLRRRPAGDIWQGLYEPPLLEFDAPPSDTEVLTAIGRLFPDSAMDIDCLSRRVKHVLTHRVLLVDFYKANVRPGTVLSGYQIVPLSVLDDYPVPRLVERLLQILFRSDSPC